jgi:hypothetical protein
MYFLWPSSATCFAFCALTSVVCFTSSTVVVVSLTAVEVSAAPEVNCDTEAMISLPDDASTLTPSTISWICRRSVATIVEKALPRASASERGVASTVRSPAAIFCAICALSLREWIIPVNACAREPISS